MDRNPTSEELSEALKMKIDSINELTGLKNKTVSLDKPIKNQGNTKNTLLRLMGNDGFDILDTQLNKE